MGRRADDKLVYKRPTVDLMLETIGRSRMTAEQVSRLTGCGYTHTGSFLASLWRKHILERDPEGYKPIRYWIPEGDKDESKRRSVAGGYRNLDPLKGPGPRGGKGKSERARPIPVAEAGGEHPARDRSSGTASAIQAEIKSLLMKRDAINRQLGRLGYKDDAD